MPMTRLTDEERITEVARHIESIIDLLGEDCTREGLVKTPVRAAKALWFLTSGYRNDPESLMKQALFEHEGSQVIIVKDIEFYSMCEHQLVPFFGQAHVAYIPAADGRICGLSKLARLVDAFAKRPQVQERLTSQIADTLVQELHPEGVLVVLEAEHLCMSMRGVKKPGSKTTTSAVRGIFERRHATRSEALSLIVRG